MSEQEKGVNEREGTAAEPKKAAGKPKKAAGGQKKTTAPKAKVATAKKETPAAAKQEKPAAKEVAAKQEAPAKKEAPAAAKQEETAAKKETPMPKPEASAVPKQEPSATAKKEAEAPPAAKQEKPATAKKEAEAPSAAKKEAPMPKPEASAAPKQEAPKQEASAKKEVELMTPGQERFGRRFIRTIAKVQVFLYRASGGRIAKTFNGGQVALVTMLGRRTGRRITLPLVYAEDGKNILFAASQGGMSTHPIWYHNLVANPDVEIQIGQKRMKCRMREATDAEAPALWAKLETVYPDFAEYRERAKLSQRKIPLLIMEPRAEP